MKVFQFLFILLFISFICKSYSDEHNEILNYSDNDGKLIDKVLSSRDLRRSIVATMIISKWKFTSVS